MRRRFGEFVLDDSQRQLLRYGEGAVHISPKAFELLLLLTDRAPAAVSKEEIVRVIWPNVDVSDASLTNVVAEIRAATGDRARQPRFVRTLQGFGYAFCEVPAAERRDNGMTADAVRLEVADHEARHHNLPVPLTNFIGREREIAALRRLAVSTRLLTLTGAGGCGTSPFASTCWLEYA